MDALVQLRTRYEANAKRISELRKEIEALEVQQHEIGVAERVLAALAIGEAPKATTAPPVQFPIAMDVPMPPDDERVTIKGLILAELKKISPLTKMDIVSRLRVMGHEVNSTTVGTTLSKMVGKEVEKAGPFAYRLKGEDPVPAGSSGATTSDVTDLA